MFRHNDGTGWTLLLDNWQDGSGYTVLESPNLDTWTRLTNPTPPLYNASVGFPTGVRQGSVIRLSQAQIDTLRSEFGRAARLGEP